jgi:hypothetical protein
MSLTIDTLTLEGVNGSGGDLQWVDEFAEGSDLVGVVMTVNVTGSLTFQGSAQQAGRRMTLQGGRVNNGAFGVITRAEVDALRALSAVPLHEFDVTLPDGRIFRAMFRRSDGPAIEATPIKHIVPHEAADLYLPTIRLVLT